MRNRALAISASVAILLAIPGAIFALRRSAPAAPPNPRLQLEAALKEKGVRLLSVSCSREDRAAARSLTFTPATLASHALYLIDPGSPADYIYVGNDGAAERCGQPIGLVRTCGRILLSGEATTLFLDNVAVRTDLRTWQLYWVASETRKPDLAREDFPKFTFYDGFMRKKLDDSNWKIHSGTWALNQHGGGMPITDAEAHSEGFARAVNPFDVLGSGSGILSYPDYDVAHGHVEARFYFGVPKQGNVVDASSLPADTNMLVLLGKLDGQQVAFGWYGARGRFALLARERGEPWTVLKEWQGKRPPRTDWVKIGLDLCAGHVARGYLDDVEAASGYAPRAVMGPFHIACGEGPVEMDDVRAWSLPAARPQGHPVFVTSRLFAAKKEKGGSDPPQFKEWAKAARTFVEHDDVSAAGETLRFCIVRRPLFGDFLYESVPHHQDAGDIPNGTYEFRLHRKDSARRTDAKAKEVLFSMRIRRTDEGWEAPDLKTGAWPEGHREFTLRLARSAEDGGRLSVKVGDAFVPVSDPLAGPVHLAVGRVFAADSPPDRPLPRPEHHVVCDSNLVHEFFEEAPTDWSWMDGKFRMDARWACFNQWNFMACGSMSVPCMASKRTFHGDQEHDAFFSLRPVFPWDIGDPDFSYNPGADPGWKIFVAHQGWYNRHDLNFSFCTDGLNPLSGYAVVFAGDDNTVTRLLRKGTVVAETRAAKFLIPKQQDHGVIHWLWWHIAVAKYKGQVRAYLNDELMLEYEDPEPLEGGHVNFWSVRNGFTVSRASSTAERIASNPHVMYVDDGQACDWRPLLADGVSTRKQEGALATQVRLNSGAGFHAVRHTFSPPANLRKTPVLRLPIRLPDGLKLNLHLYISGRSYLIQLTAPLAMTKSLLTPQYEKGEQFRIPVMDVKAMAAANLLAMCETRDGTIECNLIESLAKLGPVPDPAELQCITVGNTSNDGYLLAGNGGNSAGMTFELGKPDLREPTIDGATNSK